MSRIRVHPRCTDFSMCISNARYPNRPDTSQATSELSLPIHDKTSHYRSALEYFCTFVEDRQPGLKDDAFADYAEEVKDYATGEIVYKSLEQLQAAFRK